MINVLARKKQLLKRLGTGVKILTFCDNALCWSNFCPENPLRNLNVFGRTLLAVFKFFSQKFDQSVKTIVHYPRQYLIPSDLDYLMFLFVETMYVHSLCV